MQNGAQRLPYSFHDFWRLLNDAWRGTCGWKRSSTTQCAAARRVRSVAATEPFHHFRLLRCARKSIGKRARHEKVLIYGADGTGDVDDSNDLLRLGSFYKIVRIQYVRYAHHFTIPTCEDYVVEKFSKEILSITAEQQQSKGKLKLHNMKSILSFSKETAICPSLIFRHLVKNIKNYLQLYSGFNFSYEILLHFSSTRETIEHVCIHVQISEETFVNTSSNNKVLSKQNAAK